MVLSSFFLLTDCCLPVCPPAMLSPSRLPGAVFDRQASIRRSLINTDTVSRRPKKVKRRKTISGLPDNINQELGMNLCGALCCPLLSVDLYQHSGRASCLLSLLPITLPSVEPHSFVDHICTVARQSPQPTSISLSNTR